MIRTASCCCTELTIQVAGEPVLSGICSCDDCRRRTGSAFGWSAYFENDQILQRTGGARTYAVDAWAPQHRYFCPECGSTLYWTTGAFPGLTGVAGGSFVDNPLPAPKASFRNTKRCAWIALPGDWEMHP